MNDGLGKAGPPVETERWPKHSVSYSPYCGVLGEGPHYVGQRSFCEKEKVRGLLVQHRNDVDKGRAVGPSLLIIYGKEFEFNGRLG